KEGLLDQETLLNTKANWDGKVEGDKAGNYFHWAETSSDRLENMHKNTGVQADYAVHPIPEVPGYEGFYTWKRLTPPAWVIKNNKDEKKLMTTLKLLNDLYDKSIWNDLYLGVEGMHYTVQDGKALRLADDKSTQENVIFEPYKHLATLDFYADLLKNTSSEDRMWAVDQAIRNMHEAQKYAKIIAGDGLPASIYDGFADINNRTLYVEYATKIILGQFPIDKFDEFVEKWYKSGGEEVTKRAREWYEKANQ